jgi:Secretion system C-terminal sorting domain
MGYFISTKKTQLLLLLALNVLLLRVNAQFGTPTIDGYITPLEYGSHTNGDNQYLGNYTNYYITWDANNLYLAAASTINLLSDPALFYFDVNPLYPSNSGTNSDGSLAGFNNYDDNLVNQPFRADFLIYFKNTYHEYRYADGSNGWGTQVSNSLTNAVFAGTPQVMEIVIPWNTLTNGNGRPSSFNWHACRVSRVGIGNKLFDTAPIGSPTINSTLAGVDIANARNYFAILNTDNGTSTKPCSARCLTYYEDNSAAFIGGHYQNGGSFYDFTINDNSINNNDNNVGYDLPDNQEIANRVLVDGNISIAHNLYIGQSSALLPANNLGPNINSTITMSGATSNIFNYGRIDCNPDVNGVFGDWNYRKLNFIFSGTTTLNAHTIGRSRTRFSDITINAGASLLNPPTGLFEFDLQWGTLNNNGTINFGNGSAGSVNFGIRGDVAISNEYNFNSSSSTGQFNFNNIIIGKNSARLQPLAGGNKVTMNLKSDFENYSEFLGFNAGGEIDVIFSGTKKQFIKANINETIATNFHNLEINNNNGLANNNANADVEFLTFGGGEANYLITGELKLTSGDLVTKDRNPPYTSHKVVLAYESTVDYTNVKSDVGSNPSSFVDGPLSAEISDFNELIGFPIGKNGDYRKLTILANHISPVNTSYTAEIFQSSAISLGNSLPAVPEIIFNVSNQRFWNIKCDNSPNVSGNIISLDYNDTNLDDGVIDALGLRIVRANEGGSNSWINLSPFSGGSANANGSIETTVPTNLFGDFTFGNASINPLPIELIVFKGSNIDRKNILQWTTATEINNNFFTLERSKDNFIFESLGTIQAAGNSTVLVNYEFTDNNPLQSVNYYRLKQTDFNQTFTYSESIAINNTLNSNANSLILYDEITATLFVESSEASKFNFIEIYNSSGQIVLSKQFNEKFVSISIQNLSSGLYVCKFNDSVLKIPGYKFLR